MKSLKLILVLIGLQGILYAQSTIQDSVYYTTQQDINCLRCLQTEQLKDSLIVTYKLQNESCDSVITELQKNNVEVIKLAEKQTIKIIKLRWNVVKGILGGVLVGFVTGAIVF